MTRKLLLLLWPVVAIRGASVAADSARGEELFTTQACVQCHSINGKGGTIGPDLGRRIDRNFTPASLAATMWNHAPTMWGSMRQRDVQLGELNEQAAADLFAYFYATLSFERRGDAGRGKRLFSAKHCADCHGLSDRKIPEAKPVGEWQSINQPIALVNAMWNHATTMRQEFAKRKLSWPELTPQDLTDMLVYLRTTPGTIGAVARVEISSGGNGKALFASKGCAGCHRDQAALARRIQGETLTGIAVAMWNHQPKMPAAPEPLQLMEMQEIASYLWAEQFFADRGSATAGRRVFVGKHCAACHTEAGGAPTFLNAGRSFSAPAMVSALWRHGPHMQDQMKAKSLAWPRFDGQDMANLLAYLNSQSQGK